MRQKTRVVFVNDAKSIHGAMTQMIHMRFVSVRTRKELHELGPNGRSAHMAAGGTNRQERALTIEPVGLAAMGSRGGR